MDIEYYIATARDIRIYNQTPEVQKSRASCEPMSPDALAETILRLFEECKEVRSVLSERC